VEWRYGYLSLCRSLTAFGIWRKLKISSALDDFSALLSRTVVIKQVLDSLTWEPALNLGHINREYEKSGQCVPDHLLQLGGFLGEDSLKALVDAGLVIRETSQYSIYCYTPTPAGREQYQKLKAAGFFKD
jgi:hypothetical protein